MTRRESPPSVCFLTRLQTQGAEEDQTHSSVTHAPLRTQATDIANACLDGVDGFLLGAETVRGALPGLRCASAPPCEREEDLSRWLSTFSTFTTLPPAASFLPFRRQYRGSFPLAALQAVLATSREAEKARQHSLAPAARRPPEDALLWPSPIRTPDNHSQRALRSYTPIII